jgi:hypothetical protein
MGKFTIVHPYIPIEWMLKDRMIFVVIGDIHTDQRIYNTIRIIFVILGTSPHNDEYPIKLQYTHRPNVGSLCIATAVTPHGCIYRYNET